MFKHNQYFDGNVASLAFQGEKLATTVGVMASGEYTFSTNQKETMTVVSGRMTVKLPACDWQDYNSGDSFVVAAGASFDLKITADCAYMCTYE